MPHSLPVGRGREVLLKPTPLAMVWQGVGRAHEMLAVPGVVLQPGDILVEVELATVCGSDLHTVRGHRASARPVVLGHEQLGRIVRVGEHARASNGIPLLIGMRVVWSLIVSCGNCDRCDRGLTQKCRSLQKYGHERVRRGWELSGGFATHVHVLAGTAVVVVDAGVPAAVLAPASCATATVAAALDAAGEVVPLDGTTVLITGAGMLGITACAMATDAGATVLVTDPDPARRALALDFGAVGVADPSAAPGDESAMATVLGILTAAGLAGPLIVLELSGASTALRMGLDVVGVGGVVVLVGSVSPGEGVSVEPESLVRRLITVRGVHNYAPVHLERAVAYLTQAWHRYPFAALVGDRLPLDDVDTALELAASGLHLRVGLVPRPAATARASSDRREGRRRAGPS